MKMSQLCCAALVLVLGAIPGNLASQTAPTKIKNLEGIRFADQFPSIQAAIDDAAASHPRGAVIIPPEYTGTDAFTNPNNIWVADLRPGKTGAAGDKLYIDARAFGCAVDGVTDDSGCINSAIGAAVSQKIGIVQLPCGSLMVSQIIDLTNKPGLTFRGCGQNSGNPFDIAPNVTELMCNTGDVCVDFTGSGNMKVENMALNVRNSYSAPSPVVMLFGRDNAKVNNQTGGFCYPENNEIDHVKIGMDDKISANGGAGRVGIYNVGSENFYVSNSQFFADVTMWLTGRRDLPMVSTIRAHAKPPDGLSTGCDQNGDVSMSDVTVINCVITPQGTSNAIQANGANFSFINVDWVGQGRNPVGSAINFGSGGTFNVTIKNGQFEQWNGYFMSSYGNVDHLDVDVWAGSTTGTFPYFSFFKSNLTVKDSRIRIFNDDQTKQQLLNNRWPATWRGGEIDLSSTKSPLNASNWTLVGTVVHAAGFIDSQLTFAPNSQYLLLDDSGQSIQGSLNVNGTLSKRAGSFKIDHPLDPVHKTLSHSFVESPDMKNIYDGVVTLDGEGKAEVVLPSYFEALNKDFRYQLSCIGEFAPVFISREIQNNTFQIAGGKPGLRVSWTVTGIRHDDYANAHRIQVEEEKPGSTGRPGAEATVSSQRKK